MLRLVFQEQKDDPSAAESKNRHERESSEEPRDRSSSWKRLYDAIDSIRWGTREGRGNSLISLAITSGNIFLVKYVVTLDYYNKSVTKPEVRRKMA